MPQPHPQQKGKRAGARARKSQALPPVRLEERTREELYELARELGIPGFGEMSKTDLIEAIRRR